MPKPIPTPPMGAGMGVGPVMGIEDQPPPRAGMSKKRKKRRNNAKKKGGSPTTVYRGGEKFESY